MDTEMEEPRQLRGVKNRRHFYWADSHVSRLLQAVLSKVDKGPHEFERPTIEQFYLSLVKEYDLKDLENVGSNMMRSKMRHLKDAYLRAEEWMEESGKYLLMHGDQERYKEELNKITPFYDSLKKIYGPKESRGNSFFIGENDICVEINPADVKSEFINDALEQSQVQDEQNAESDEQPEVSQQVQNRNSLKRTRTAANTTASNNPTDINNLKRKFPFIDNLTKNQEKIMELKEKKLENQIAFDKRRSAFEAGMLEVKRQKFEYLKKMEEKRFELEKNKVTEELELRKVEIEKEYELKKFELQLKYNSGNNNK